VRALDGQTVAGSRSAPSPVVDPRAATVMAGTVMATRPRSWPEYLSDFEPPAGRDWTLYRVAELDGLPQTLVPAGEFLIGSPSDEQGRRHNEGPQRVVFVSAFWIDLVPVTFAHYALFVRTEGRVLSAAQARAPGGCPVTSINWGEAASYAHWAGKRLPSEAQWEKAARAGALTRYPWGDDWDPNMAHGKSTSHAGLARVNAYPPNAFGIYGMIGNVWEWCRDYYSEEWYTRMPSQDPANTVDAGAYRVVRGGSWGIEPSLLRVAYRLRVAQHEHSPYVGCRCCSDL
jgi:formylglycine-generating enzyme required for sulfatase activity